MKGMEIIKPHSRHKYVCGCYYDPGWRDRNRKERKKKQNVTQMVDLASGEVERNVDYTSPTVANGFHSHWQRAEEEARSPALADASSSLFA